MNYLDSINRYVKNANSIDDFHKFSGSYPKSN